MKVLMLPHPSEGLGNESGIKRVVEAYHRHLPKFGIEFVEPEATTYDLKVVHAGMTGGDCQVAMIHGLYWTADYSAPDWEYRVNARVIEAIRSARAVTVPSDWVAETFRRDMRFSPSVIPHGIDWADWQHKEANGGYILWNKNRVGDVCDNSILVPLAEKFPEQVFVSTFVSRTKPVNLLTAEGYALWKENPDWPINRVPVKNGLITHDRMKQTVQRAGVYLSTTKETFGIGVLEAMASGVPVLGWNYGGNVQLVEHGVNGYLAEPGNFEELCDGLAYCLKYRDVLGGNGRELARRWTWEAACEKLVEVYRAALEPEQATVSIVIPVYNKKPEELERAITSGTTQSRPPAEIIVIDDGSADGTAYEALVQQLGANAPCRIVYRRFDNGGVAIARNRGIELARSKYICALDADDWIAPEFLETCVTALEADPSLGIAYTGLRWHDGEKTGISQWPPEFNYDNQLRRQNQVPTCCVFRREAWQRSGGYKSRYCPNGAGSEDAAFWTQLGAIGYGAKRVTDEPLFHYSAGGSVGGNKEYREVDWLCMYPWVKDQQHPFASVATPNRHSHPVRQYDEPQISVVIPVGPGHEQVVQDALDSLEMQHFRKWEAIVVDDTGQMTSKDDPRAGWLTRQYPYARIVNTTGEKGAGYCRNLGATLGRAPFLFFLDADDILNQPDALDKLLAGWKQEEAIIYSDYLGKSTWPKDRAEREFGNRLLGYLEKRGQAIVRYFASDYDYDRAIKEPKFNKDNPAMPYYLWCTVSVLIPKAWHVAIGGFDEAMGTWEDADYFWRLARAGYCFRRIAEPLLLYDYDTGHRREAGNPRDEEGRQKHQMMIQYITRKYENLGPKMCNCRGRRNGGVTTPEAIVTGKVQTVYGSDLKDEDFEIAEFQPDYTGNRQLVGATTKIKYGYSRRAGDKFLVHKADIASQRRADGLPMFIQATIQPTVPKVETKPLPEPEPVVIQRPAVEPPRPVVQQAKQGSKGKRR